MRVVVLILIWCAVAVSQPLDASSWKNPDGTTSKTHPPVAVNYDSAGTWTLIQDDFTQIGNRQAWKTRSGPFTLYVDSLGAVIWRKGDHYLGFEPPLLIKVNASDTSETVLATFDPDTVYATGASVVFRNAFPGVDVRVVSENKVMQSVAPYEYEFTDSGRSWLAIQGPWGNRYVGTATQLVTDSLDATVQFDDADVAWTEQGIIVDGMLRLRSGGDHVAYITDEYVVHGDSGITDIRVRKFLIQRPNLTRWMVELFDAAQANQLPSGSFSHRGQLGHTSTTITGKRGMDGTVYLVTENENGSSVWRMTEDGTADSVTLYVDKTGTGDHDMGWAIYDSTATPIDSTATMTNDDAHGTDAWWGSAALVGVSMQNGEVYYPAGWSASESGTTISWNYWNNSLTDTLWIDSEVWGNSWPSPHAKSFPNAAGDRPIAYITYTVSATGGIKGRRRKIVEGGL